MCTTSVFGLSENPNSFALASVVREKNDKQNGSWIKFKREITQKLKEIFKKFQKPICSLVLCSNAENLSKIDLAVNELETTQNRWEKKKNNNNNKMKYNNNRVIRPEVGWP